MSTEADNKIDIKIVDEDIPVLSAVATRAIEMIRSEKTTAKDLEKLIGTDPSLASTILRLASSPIYGGRVPIRSIGQAVVRLGMNQLRNTVLIAATGDVFDMKDPYVRDFWSHSMAVGIVSRWLADKTRLAGPEECFVAGMLHDIGKVIIYGQEADFYRKLIDGAREDEVRFFQRETESIAYCDHALIGGLVGRKWGLNSEIVEAIRFHHEIEGVDAAPPLESETTTATVSIANLLANQLGYGCDVIGETDICATAAGKILDLDPEQILNYLEELPELIDKQLEDIL